ncbi:anti-sigma factor [Aquibacillus sp. 3ASR75-11]|uniref:Regulator of SigK n=1 Tax=Terrihalobacillus insolitus TaxID=2950438 RepID=A0A9X3WW05_9BACI|nr:anti-sigma factor [Terrihalobacillus insolitus]MDC3413468.1 anti-sigma factor [Terrihalobacillus insolitus]MDC3425241.1 anti-sigma factor [Terrihalobacillus insolitus]
MKYNHVDEEIIVDFILNNLTNEKKEAVESHLFSCEKCRIKFQVWNDTIGGETQPKEINPSPKLKSRLMNSIEALPPKRKKRQTFWKKPAIVLMSLTAGFILVIGLFQLMRDDSPSYVVMQNNEAMGENVLSDPNTTRLNIEPMSNDNRISGDIWLNNTTDELFLKVGGLTPLSTKDYQLWVVHTNDKWDGKILNIQDGSALVYYKGSDLGSLKLLKVSIEPSGGSATPTGPETFFIDLKEQR